MFEGQRPQFKKTNVKQLVAWAKEYDSKPRADDPRFRRFLRIIMEDGSVFDYKDAFAASKDGWVVWFTEHYGYGFADPDDVIAIEQYNRIRESLEDL